MSREDRRYMEKLLFDHNLSSTLESRTKMAGMGEMAVSTSKDFRHYVGTSELHDCAGIAVYDSEAKVAGVAHVDFDYGNPLSFGRFAEFSRRLIDAADAAGGKSYTLYSFNVPFGERTPEHNSILDEIASATAIDLLRRSKIKAYLARDERQFLLDSRDGRIIIGNET